MCCLQRVTLRTVPPPPQFNLHCHHAFYLPCVSLGPNPAPFLLPLTTCLPAPSRITLFPLPYLPAPLVRLIPLIVMGRRRGAAMRYLSPTPSLRMPPMPPRLTLIPMVNHFGFPPRSLDPIVPIGSTRTWWKSRSWCLVLVPSYPYTTLPNLPHIITGWFERN